MVHNIQDYSNNLAFIHNYNEYRIIYLLAKIGFSSPKKI